MDTLWDLLLIGILGALLTAYVRWLQRNWNGEDE